MRAKMIPVIDELQRLAREQDWQGMSADLNAMAESSEGCTAVIVAAAESDPNAFLMWAAAQGLGAGMDSATFREINLKARITPHLIAFFAADHLIEAAEVEAVAQNFFTRPAGSYVVVIDVGNLCSEEDVRVVERSAWRLLVNDPPPNWTQAELVAHGVYFWSPGEVTDFLRGRVETDSRNLVEWLRGPGGAREELEAREAAEMVSVGEELFRQQRGRRLSGNAARVRELAATMDEITEFRDRLNRRLDSDAELLVAEVTAAMRSWSILLKESINSTWSDVFRGNRTIATEMARSIVESKLREVSPVWAAGIGELIQTHRTEFKRDAGELYQFVNWKLINQVTRDSGVSADYPEALLAWAVAGGDRLESRVTGGTPMGGPQPTESKFVRNLVVLGLPVSLGVGAAATWIMRFPVGIPVGLLAGYLSTVAASQGRVPGCDMEQCRRFAADAVKHFLDRAIAHFQSETRMVVARFRQHVGEDVRRLHGLLEQAMQASYGSGESADDKEISRSLAEMRRRLGTILQP
jgi:hypothetical protein